MRDPKEKKLVEIAEKDEHISYKQVATQPKKGVINWLIGRPLPSADAPHQTIGKAVGLAVFASDALSSTAYATQEILVILALAVQSWHVHIITAATLHHVSKIAKCAKDAVRWKLRLDRPIWATDFDKRFTFEPWLVRKRIDYVELHNVDDGLPRRPWDFIQDWKDPSI